MLKMNIHFMNIFNIAIIAILIDILVYAINIPYNIAILISSILIVILNGILIKKNKIKIQHNFELLDILFWAIIVVIASLNIAIPDFSYDVSNYHIYLQNNICIDKINFDFFAGKTVNGFLFALGDRMHYIFRYILGYRLGTILSYYALIVLFYQIKNIFNIMSEKNKLIPIFSMLCCSSYIIFQWAGTYYIDNLSIIFILQIVYYVIKEKNILKNKKLIYFLSVITGIATAIKLTNLVLIIPILIYILIREKKNINKKLLITLLVSSILFIIPFIVYIIDNIIQTGSPIFPYYNSIFKSKFFGQFNWKDDRFKMDSIVHILIWPVYVSVIFKGYGDDCQITDPIWAIGYIVVICFTLYSLIIRKKNTKIYEISILSIILTIVWIIFLEGYMRYALIIPILYGIVMFGIIINKLNLTKLNNLIKIIISIIILGGTIIIITSNINQNILQNYKYILKDKEEYKINIDGAWGVISDDSALTNLVREKDVPIYNLGDSLIKTSEKNLDIYYDKICNKDIYVLMTTRNMEYKLFLLNQNDFSCEFVKSYTINEIPYISAQDTLYLYKVNYIQ